MVLINYVDGSSETVEAREDTFYHSNFRYNEENQSLSFLTQITSMTV